jgi:hypothetical protein
MNDTAWYLGYREKTAAAKWKKYIAQRASEAAPSVVTKGRDPAVAVFEHARRTGTPNPEWMEPFRSADSLWKRSPHPGVDDPLDVPLWMDPWRWQGNRPYSRLEDTEPALGSLVGAEKRIGKPNIPDVKPPPPMRLEYPG